MKTIFKYPLKTDLKHTISMPVGAEILSMQIQNGTPCIWALVDTDKPEEEVGIRIIMTGCEIRESEKLERFIGTIQFKDGEYVLHVFKEKL